jgi:hypothetical protein
MNEWMALILGRKTAGWPLQCCINNCHWYCILTELWRKWKICAKWILQALKADQYTLCFLLITTSPSVYIIGVEREIQIVDLKILPGCTEWRSSVSPQKIAWLNLTLWHWCILCSSPLDVCSYHYYVTRCTLLCIRIQDYWNVSFISRVLLHQIAIVMHKACCRLGVAKSLFAILVYQYGPCLIMFSLLWWRNYFGWTH